MGVTDAIARSATGRAHVLLVEVPGRWQTRATVERAVLARGWSLAGSAADADLLVVCGKPRPQLELAIDLVWHQMPGPRVRVEIADDAQAEEDLDQARDGLLDTEHHRHDAHTRPGAPDLLVANKGHDHESMGHESMGHGSMGHDDGGDGGMDHGSMDHGSMDHGSMGHDDGGDGGMDHGSMGHDDGGDGGMDHGSMDHGGHGDMEMAPGGIALAVGGEDRDGLEMDVLNVRLGPVLSHWPAGLVLRCALQGDVITQARAEILDVETQQLEAGPGTGPAMTLDHVVSLLALAGWEDAAGEARRVRDAVLEGGDRAATLVHLDGLRAKVTRSRVLRWSLRGLRPLGRDRLEQHGLPPHLAGDTYDRLLGMLERAGDDKGKTALPWGVDTLPHLVTGLELAAARLVVASLDVQGLQPGRLHDGMTGA